MFKKLLLVGVVAGVAALMIRKLKEHENDRELWEEATASADLRTSPN